MCIKQALRRFGRDESGATTTDWIVLTAAIVALGAATAGVVASGTGNAAEGLEECMERSARWLQRDNARTNTHEKRLTRMERGCQNGMKAT